MRQPVFLDTSAIIAIVNEDDALHQQALVVIGRLGKEKEELATTDYILDEVASAFSKSHHRHLAVEAIESVKRSASIKVIHVSEPLFERGWQLYKERPDKNWSLTDCISMIVMADNQITTAFTSDAHFEQAGFTRLMHP